MEIILKYFSDFTHEQLRQFGGLKELYRDWNSKINVISRKDIDGLYEKHVLHSLSIAAVFDFQPGMEILDIGTGGGFPGIPLAIYFPQVRFHLVDSIAKKLKVVEGIAAEIELRNVTTQNTRVEEMRVAGGSLRKFDFVVSRAVAPLKHLWKWSTPLLRHRPTAQESLRTGRAGKTFGPNKRQSGLICLKGGDLAMEIKESGTMPHLVEIFEIFPEEYFHQKYLLYVPS